jgi:hypothetical protein
MSLDGNAFPDDLPWQTNIIEICIKNAIVNAKKGGALTA